MAQISVTVAGRLYRMACADGEEEHISALARAFDEKIAEFKAGIGDIGDMRLHVMAGIFFVDQAAELKRRLLDAEDRSAELGEKLTEAGHAQDLAAAAIAEAIDEACGRIDGLVRRVSLLSAGD